MAAITMITGYFGTEAGASLEGKVRAGFVARGLSGSLSLEFPGQYRLDIPFRPIEQLAAGVREASGLASSREPVEQSVKLDGFFSNRWESSRACPVTAWFGRRSGFETLSVAAGEQGQISVPYAPIEALVRGERRNMV